MDPGSCREMYKLSLTPNPLSPFYHPTRPPIKKRISTASSLAPFTKDFSPAWQAQSFHIKRNMFSYISYWWIQKVWLCPKCLPHWLSWSWPLCLSPCYSKKKQKLQGSAPEDTAWGWQIYFPDLTDKSNKFLRDCRRTSQTKPQWTGTHTTLTTWSSEGYYNVLQYALQKI